MIRCQTKIQIKPVSDLQENFLDIEKIINKGVPAERTQLQAPAQYSGQTPVRLLTVQVCYFTLSFLHHFHRPHNRPL